MTRRGKAPFERGGGAHARFHGQNSRRIRRCPDCRHRRSCFCGRSHLALVLARCPPISNEHTSFHPRLWRRCFHPQRRTLHQRLRWRGAVACTGVHPDEEALGPIVERTISESIRSDLGSIFEQMAKCHITDPHWYLPMIGVDPACQRNGHGSRLMAYALQQFDRDHMPAYLESTNPRNIPFYRRHGFEPVGEIQAGASPVITPMLRPAR